MKTLILFAHPALHKSRVNKHIIEGLPALECVTFRDLYEEYPEFDIDVKCEQEMVEQHDIIIFQFPLFWYSTPALLKEWQDLVLEHGWAFGSSGNALKDKLFMCSITAGGPRKAYTEKDFHQHTLNQLLSPLRQTATLCKMIPLPPFVVFGAHGIQLPDITEHKSELLRLLESFRTGSFDPDRALEHEYMNDYVAQLKKS